MRMFMCSRALWQTESVDAHNEWGVSEANL